MFSDNDVVRIAPDVLASEIDNEAVILGVTSGKYFGLDETGTEIWNNIQNPIRISDLLVRLWELYEGNRDEIRKETLSFLSELLERNLIEIADESQ